MFEPVQAPSHRHSTTFRPIHATHTRSHTTLACLSLYPSYTLMDTPSFVDWRPSYNSVTPGPMPSWPCQVMPIIRHSLHVTMPSLATRIGCLFRLGQPFLAVSYLPCNVGVIRCAAASSIATGGWYGGTDALRCDASGTRPRPPTPMTNTVTTTWVTV